MRFFNLRNLAIAAAMAWGGVFAPASAQHFDVATASDSAVGGKLVNGGFDDGTTTGIFPVRVFEGELVPGVNPGDPYESENPGEPGFRAFNQANLNNPTIFTPNAGYFALEGEEAFEFDFVPMAIGANTRNLFYWDGTGSVNFVPVASTYELSLEKKVGSVNSPVFTTTIDGADNALVAGTSIQESLVNGAVHTHLFTSLDVDSGGPLDPAEGFYLYSLQFRMTGFTTSDPAFFVFGALDPDDFTVEELEAFEELHEEAVAWVEANLVPEPSSATLAMLGLAGLGLARRRRVCK